MAILDYAKWGKTAEEWMNQWGKTFDDVTVEEINEYIKGLQRLGEGFVPMRPN